MAFPVQFANLSTATGAQLDGNFNALSANTGAALVGFTQSGTGAVTTTLQSKVQQTINLSDFGNTSAAIQAAVNSLVGTGVILGDLNATYTLTAQITVPIGVTIDLRGARVDASALNVPAFYFNKNAVSVPTFVVPPTGLRNAIFVGAAVNTAAYCCAADRLPLVSFENISYTNINAISLTGECLVAGITNVRGFQVPGTAFSCTVGTGAFGPNAAQFNHCWAENANGATTIGFYSEVACFYTDCYAEGLHTAYDVVGGVIKGGSLNARTVNAVGIKNRGRSLIITGLLSNISTANTVTFLQNFFSGAFITCNANEITIDSATGGNPIIFEVTASFSLALTGGIIYNNSTSTPSVFDVPTGQSVLYSTFQGCSVYAVFGQAINFVSPASVGTLFAMAITGNSFLRVTNFINLSSTKVCGNNISVGDATSTFTANLTGGELENNDFLSVTTFAITTASGTVVNNNHGFGRVDAVSGNLTAVTAIPDTVTPTTGGVTLAAQTAVAGATWRVRAFGTFVAVNSATARNAQVSPYWGTTALPVISVPVLASVAQTTNWELEFILSASSTTAVWTSGNLKNKFNLPAIVAGTSANMEIDVATPASTVVTAGAQTIDLRFSMSVAVATDTWNIHGVTMERLT